MKFEILPVLLCLLLVHTAAYALDESDLKTEVVTVTRVADGDTLNVILSDGKTEAVVRFLAIQAMEEHDAEDGIPDCNATNATDRLAEILGCDDDDNCPNRPQVILKVWDESQRATSNRLLRYIFMDDGKGGEINIGLQLVEEGYVLAWPNNEESLYNDELWLAQQTAMSNKTGPLWNRDESQCRDADHDNLNLDIWVNWDAEGDDTQNINDEWVKIQNNGNSSIDLSSWWLRDTGLQEFYQFPEGSVLPAGKIITVHVGSGTDSSYTFYMNESYSIFDNKQPDGAYLHDYWDVNGDGSDTSKTGDIIGAFIYPCTLNCTDPLQGKLTVTANYDADGDDSINPNGEWVDIRNTSSESADLLKYRLCSDPEGSSIYNFDTNSIIYPGETLRVYIGKGSESRLEKYWGYSSGILSNNEDRVWLDSYDGIEIDDYSWPVETYTPASGGVSMIPIYQLLFR